MKKLVLVATLGALLAGCNSDSNPFDFSDDKSNDENVIVTEDGVTIITDGNDTIIDGNGNFLDENGNIIENGNGSQENAGGVVAAAIAGTYAWDAADNGGDEGYWVVSASGLLSVYNYAGDSYDNEGNCYYAYQNVAVFRQISGTKYRMVMLDGESDFDYIVDFDNRGAVISADIPNSGSLLYPSSSLVVSDFSPEC